MNELIKKSNCLCPFGTLFSASCMKSFTCVSVVIDSIGYMFHTHKKKQVQNSSLHAQVVCSPNRSNSIISVEIRPQQVSV